MHVVLKNSVPHESTKAYPFYRFASNESVPWPEFLVAQSEAFQHYPNISQPHTVGTLVGQLAKNLATGRARSCRGHITCSRCKVVVVAVHWLCLSAAWMWYHVHCTQWHALISLILGQPCFYLVRKRNGLQQPVKIDQQ